MSPAGLNSSFTFIRLIEVNDDEVGGSNPTGTILYRGIMGRIAEEEVDTAFLQQGLQTEKIFTAMFWGHDLLFREQDEVLVDNPPNHRYYNQRFRIISQVEPNNHPSQKRNYYLAKLKRSVISHSNNFQ